MKIDEIRSSFTVYVVSSKLADLDGLSESLRLAGYMMATFNELTAAFSELYSNPPHFVIFDVQEKGFDLRKAIEQVSSQLPESHVFLVAPFKERDKAVAFLDEGIYDLIYTPFQSATELVRTLDRAAERDYFMYLNERLMQNEVADPAVTEAAPGTSLYEMTTTGQTHVAVGEQASYARQLFEHPSMDECLRVFLQHTSRMLGGCPAVYFRYVANRRVLVALHSESVSGMEIKGMGINFNDAAQGFRTAQLREPMAVGAFTGMVKELFGNKEFIAFPIEAMGEIQGVGLLIAPAPVPAVDANLRENLTLLTRALSLVECEKRLHVVSIKDLATDTLNRNTFRTKVSEEISRSRRTRMPVSLVQIAIDQYGQLASNYGSEEAQLIMRTVARILDKHSRVNDIVGRTSPDEFGLLLPHTNKQGAMIKAERLRRIFESAAFDRVLKDFPRLTVSVGVSEYPSLSRDAEELLHTADEALYQVRKAGNKVCVAQAVDNFEPDFTVPNIPTGAGTGSGSGTRSGTGS